MLSTIIMGTGRMGSLIKATAESMTDTSGEALFDIKEQIGFDTDALASAPAANVIIDFSNACTLPAVAAYVERTGAALVSGTTGYTAEQLEQVKQLGKHTPVMWSGNYSIGVAALRHLVAQATRELPGFDIEICETHPTRRSTPLPARQRCCLTRLLPPNPSLATTPSMAAKAYAASAIPKRSACIRCVAAPLRACTR